MEHFYLVLLERNDFIMKTIPYYKAFINSFVDAGVVVPSLIILYLVIKL